MKQTVLLGFVLCIALEMRLYQLNYNSPFLDEAAYIVIGRQILDGHFGAGIEALTWMGGFPFFYPLFSAGAYVLGGIVASRIIVACLGTVLTYLIYRFTNQLTLLTTTWQNRMAGIIAAAWFATSTIPLAFERLAIYDTLCFFLFLFGICMLHKALYEGERRHYMAAAMLFILSFLAKYITVMYLPIICIFTIFLSYIIGGKQGLKVILLYFCLPITFCLGGYILLNWPSLRMYTSNPAVSQHQSAWSVWNRYWQYTTLTGISAVPGMIQAFKSRRPLFFILPIFAFWIVPIHMIEGNTGSVDQHSVYTLMFLTPFIGMWLTFILSKEKLRTAGYLLIFILIGINTLYTYHQLPDHLGYWKNTTSAMNFFVKKVAISDRIIAESDKIAELALYSRIPPDRIIGPFDYSYNGKIGPDAYIETIKQNDIRFIELDNTDFPTETRQKIESFIQGTYQKIYQEDNIRIYKKSI
jgi:hypothetical protein